MHFLLMYEVVEDYLERRKPFRAEHFAHAQRSFDRGELVLAGAFLEPVDAAALVFRGPTEAAAQSFAREDPYVLNGLVKSWKVRQWATVIGDGEVLPKL